MKVEGFSVGCLPNSLDFSFESKSEEVKKDKEEIHQKVIKSFEDVPSNSRQNICF